MDNGEEVLWKKFWLNPDLEIFRVTPVTQWRPRDKQALSVLQVVIHSGKLPHPIWVNELLAVQVVRKLV